MIVSLNLCPARTLCRSMEHRLVSRRQYGKRRRRRQDGERRARWRGNWQPVAGERPWAEFGVVPEVWPASDLDHGPIRYICQRATRPLGWVSHALGMQHIVHVAGARRRPASNRLRPKTLKAHGIRASALETRPVPGGKGRRLIEKEQLCVATWAHEFAPPALERQHAADPPLRGPLAPLQCLVVVVKAAATDTHHGATVWCRNDLATRRDAVLQGHGEQRAQQ